MIAAAAALSTLAGCASTSFGLRTGSSPTLPGSAPAVGTSYQTAAVQAEVSPGAYFGLVMLGYLIVSMQEQFGFRGPDWRRPPEMAEDRSVVERDCSAALAPPVENLRCK